MKTLITISNPNLKKMVINQNAIDKLQNLSTIDWVEEERSYTSEDLAGMIEEYDACITSWGSPKFTPPVLEKAKKLKFVGHAAGTVIPIVDESIFDRDIAVVNSNFALSKSTAELTLAIMQAGAWNIRGYLDRLNSGQWSMNYKETVLGLYKQVIGLIGYGDICKEVIRLLQPYDAQILLCSDYCSQEEARDLGVTLCSMEELLQKSAIISLHKTLTPASEGLLGEKELKLIRDGALLVNTARGPIIQEEALIKELETGRLFAALDVYDKEPLAVDHPFQKMPNVLCTPHIGGYSNYWKSRLGEFVVDDLDRFLKGISLQGQITLDKYRRLTPR